MSCLAEPSQKIPGPEVSEARREFESSCVSIFGTNIVDASQSVFELFWQVFSVWYYFSYFLDRCSASVKHLPQLGLCSIESEVTCVSKR